MSRKQEILGAVNNVIRGIRIWLLVCGVGRAKVNELMGSPENPRGIRELGMMVLGRSGRRDVPATVNHQASV